MPLQGIWPAKSGLGTIEQMSGDPVWTQIKTTRYGMDVGIEALSEYIEIELKSLLSGLLVGKLRNISHNLLILLHLKLNKKSAQILCFFP